jgi:hypothetical protein
MFCGGLCPPSEFFGNPVGDGGSINILKPLLTKHEGVGNAEAAKSGCLGGLVALPSPTFASPMADELPQELSVLSVFY